MSKVCDHTSVGIFVWREEKLLLIVRARFPKTYSLPAGHVDEHGSYEDAARAELKEEVGLDAKVLTLVAEGRKENKCRRESGLWHEWKLYKAETAGEVRGSPDEVRGTGWYTREEIGTLSERTKEYQEGAISEEEWEKSPGLEPVMCEWFKQVNII